MWCKNIYSIYFDPPLCGSLQLACASGRVVLTQIQGIRWFATEINNIDVFDLVLTGTRNWAPSEGHFICLGSDGPGENGTDLFDDLAASFVVSLGVIDVEFEAEAIEKGEKVGGGVGAAAALAQRTDLGEDGDGSVGGEEVGDGGKVEGVEVGEEQVLETGDLIISRWAIGWFAMWPAVRTRTASA